MSRLVHLVVIHARRLRHHAFFWQDCGRVSDKPMRFLQLVFVESRAGA